MRLRHIELINAITLTGSLTRAAELLHISQPAASKILANAESQLGFPLFVRVRGRLHMTQEARALAPQIAHINQELGSIRRLAANLKQNPQGRLRIGATPSLALGLLPEAIKWGRKAWPSVLFDLHVYHTSELVKRIQTRDLDLAITFTPDASPSIVRTEIGHTELLYVRPREQADAGAGPEDAGGADTLGRPLRLEELQLDNLIELDFHDHAGSLLERALTKAGKVRRTGVQVQTHYIAFALATAGCGTAIVDAIAARALARPGVRLHPLRPAIPVPINILRHESVAPLGIEAEFCEQLSRLCEEINDALPGKA